MTPSDITPIGALPGGPHAPDLPSRTYLRCSCGYREEGVCGVFYGWTCPECGGVDTADIKVRRRP